MRSKNTSQLEKFLKTVDRSKFINTHYIKRVEKPWGYEIHFTPDNLPYMGKILHINSGTRISLQVHDQKMESWYLLNGKITMLMEETKGNMVEINMEKGYGYTTHLGQKHRLISVEDADILEVSTPELGNSYRLEDDYARPTETERLRRLKNRGWNPNN